MKTKEEMILITLIVTFILSINFSLAENDLLIEPEYIKISLQPGETETGFLTIDNNGDKEVDLKLEIINKDDFMYIGDKDKESSIVIRPGQTKTVKVTISPPLDTEPDIYVNEISYMGEGIKVMTLLVVNVESLEQPILDIDLEIQSGFRRVLQGKKVLGEITLFNRGTATAIPVKIIYSIKDFTGNRIISREEDVIIETKLNFIREFKIPEYIQDGTYVFDVRVEHDGYVGMSSSVFEVGGEKVVEEAEEVQEISEKIVIWSMVIVFILFIIAIYLYNRKLNKIVKKVGELETKHIMDEIVKKK